MLFVSGELIAVPLCHRLLKEGHELKLYIHDPNRKNCLENIVPKTLDWRAELGWVGKDGLIVFDDVGFGKTQDDLRDAGYRVVGGSEGGDRLELNRAFFQEVLQSNGAAVLPSYNFETPTAAIRFIQENPNRWVLKQNAHLSDITYIGERQDGLDVESVLKNDPSMACTIGRWGIHLQAHVDGIEIGVGRYFNGRNWVGPIELNVEHKHFCNDDIGPMTPEMGTLMWYGEDETNRLFENTLGLLETYLREVNFRGDIAVNSIVDEDMIWPLEATARFGSPATALQCELHQSCWGEFLSAVADGEDYPLIVKSDWGIVVTLATPPFPYQPNPAEFHADIDTKSGVGLFFREPLTVDEQDRIHVEEISQTEGSTQLVQSGRNGITLHVTGSGSSINAARQETYQLVRKIILPKMIYRTDIGSRFHATDHEKLKDWGWLENHRQIN